MFPVLCEMNGGAAFLFCTAIFYFVLGVPVVLVESGLGHLSRRSPATLFPKLCPLLSGVYSVFWHVFTAVSVNIMPLECVLALYSF